MTAARDPAERLAALERQVRVMRHANRQLMARLADLEGSHRSLAARYNAMAERVNAISHGVQDIAGLLTDPGPDDAYEQCARVQAAQRALHAVPTQAGGAS